MNEIITDIKEFKSKYPDLKFMDILKLKQAFKNPTIHLFIKQYLAYYENVSDEIDLWEQLIINIFTNSLDYEVTNIETINKGLISKVEYIYLGQFKMEILINSYTSFNGKDVMDINEIKVDGMTFYRNYFKNVVDINLLIMYENLLNNLKSTLNKTSERFDHWTPLFNSHYSYAINHIYHVIKSDNIDIKPRVNVDMHIPNYNRFTIANDMVISVEVINELFAEHVKDYYDFEIKPLNKKLI